MIFTQSGVANSPQQLYALAIILAAFIGFIGQITYKWLETRRSRKTLERALQAEIEAMGWLTRGDTSTLRESIKKGEQLTTTYVPTDIYDSNTSEIGLLSPNDAEAVIKYYDTAHIVQDQLTEIAGSEDDEMEIRKVLADRTIPDLVEHYRDVTDREQQLESENNTDRTDPRGLIRGGT